MKNRVFNWDLTPIKMRPRDDAIKSPDLETESKLIMQLLVEVPSNLPDAAQCTPQQFMHDAKLAMAIKLFEMKRLSSGMAALLIGMSRLEFLGELHRYGASVIDLDESELSQDIANA
jgi:predicted HTH domain antitoxin